MSTPAHPGHHDPSQPRDGSGRWSQKPHGAPGPAATLAPSTLARPSSGDGGQHLRVVPDPAIPDRRNALEINREAFEVADALVARRTDDGGFTVQERQDDVEDQMRDLAPHLSDEDFDRHMTGIAAAAEDVSVMERVLADDTGDLDAYTDLASEVGVDISDFPVDDPGWYPGDGLQDHQAFAEAVLAEHDLRLHMRISALVLADDAARRSQVVSGTAAAGETAAASSA